MKILFLWSLTSLLAAVSALDGCSNDIVVGCRLLWNFDLPRCNSLYGDFRNSNEINEDAYSVIEDLQTYANDHIGMSYQYLLSATYFDNYETNRFGFGKLFKRMSDDAWNKSLGIIKHLAKRGHTVNLRPTSSFAVKVPELPALANALDYSKELAEKAFKIHAQATKNSHWVHDSEISHYLEEEFMEKQADVIRELAGYTSDVKHFVKDQRDASLALHLFDDYLTKVV